MSKRSIVVAGVEYGSLKEAAKAFGVCYGVAWARLTKRGWTLEQALGVAPAPRGKSVTAETHLARHEVDPVTGCWNWLGGTNKLGYGHWPLSHRDGIAQAHRASYHYQVGQIPEGLLVRHDCDNPRCINPAHLIVGTHQDNMDDMKSRQRQQMGERRHNAALNSAAVAAARRLTEKYGGSVKSGPGRGLYSFLARWFGVTQEAIGMAARGKNWRHIATLLLLSIFPAICNGGELHRLGAALALEVASLSASPAPTPQPPAPSGDKCPECDGTGVLGDGTIEVQCPQCNGTGRKKTEPPPAAPAPEPPKPAISTYLPPAPLTVVRNPGPKWTVGSTPPQSASLESIRRHLEQEHGIDASGYSRSQLLALHDNAHNAKTRTTTRRSTSCPTGTCPTK